MESESTVVGIILLITFVGACQAFAISLLRNLLIEVEAQLSKLTALAAGKGESDE